MVKITDIYPSEARNKPVISMTVRRAHYEDENKSPDWPGRNKVIIGRAAGLVNTFRILDY